MKNITLFNPGTALNETVQTSATTWGELKSEYPDYIPENTKGVNRQTRNTYESNDSQLPSEDCTIFIVANQIKSGYGV